MSAPSLTHQRILGRMHQATANFIEKGGGGCEVLPAPFAVFLDADGFNYVEPDISVICDVLRACCGSGWLLFAVHCLVNDRVILGLFCFCLYGIPCFPCYLPT